MKKVAILDYGAGNILSIKRAIEQLGVQTFVLDNSAEISLYDLVILPGVGSFKDGMMGLEKQGLIAGIHQYLTLDRPLLGICLGMQLLFESSEEFGYCQGLGLIAGKVLKLPNHNIEQTPQRVPHVGWSHVTKNKHVFFAQIPSEAEYYFCHSYAVYPAQSEHILAKYQYGGHPIVAAVNKEKIFGFQFHPEKSGKVGLQLLGNFLREMQIIQ